MQSPVPFHKMVCAFMLVRLSTGDTTLGHILPTFFVLALLLSYQNENKFANPKIFL